MVKNIICYELTDEESRYKTVELWMTSWSNCINEESQHNCTHPFPMKKETLDYIKELMGRKIMLAKDRPMPNPISQLTTERQNNVFQELCLETFRIFYTSYIYRGIARSSSLNESISTQRYLAKRVQSISKFLLTSKNFHQTSPKSTNYDKVDEIDDQKKVQELTNQNLSTLLLNYSNFGEEPQPNLLINEPTHLENSIWIKVEDLFLNGMIEPVYGSMSIHDISLKKKISETFYFSQNNALKLNFDFTNKKNSLFDSTECIFSYPPTHMNSLYLIVRIEKTLEKANISKYSSFYSKVCDAKSIETHQKYLDQFLPNLAHYRTFMGYVTIPVQAIINEDFKIYGSVDSRLKMVAMVRSCETLRSDKISSDTKDTRKRLTFLQFYVPVTEINLFIKDNGFTDENIYKYIQEATQNVAAQRKMNTINGKLILLLKVTFSMMSKYPRSDSVGFIYSQIISLSQSSPNLSSPISEKVIIIKNITSNEKYPNINQFHNIYIYPKSLNFSKLPKNIKNLQILIYLINKEPNNINVILLLLCVKDFVDSNLESNDHNYATMITYSDKIPAYYDEIKFELPKNLTPSMHILVVVKNINISKNFHASSIIVGLTWIPLIINGDLINGSFELPIASELLPGYSKYSAMPMTKNTKSLDKFVQKLSILSTLSIGKMIKNFAVLFNFYLSLIDEVVSLEDFIEENDATVKNAEIVFKSFVEFIFFFNDSTKYMRTPNSGKNEWLTEYIEICCFNQRIGKFVFRKELDAESKSLGCIPNPNHFRFTKSIAVEGFQTNKGFLRPDMGSQFTNLLRTLFITIVQGLKIFTEMIFNLENENSSHLVARFLYPFIASEEIMISDLIFLLLKNIKTPVPQFDSKFLNYLSFNDEFIDEHFVLIPWLKILQSDIPQTVNRSFYNYFIGSVAEFLVSVDRIAKPKWNITLEEESSELSPIVAAYLFPVWELIVKYDGESFDKPLLAQPSSSYSTPTQDFFENWSQSNCSTLTSKSNVRVNEELSGTGDMQNIQYMQNKKFVKNIFLIFVWVIRSSKLDFISFAWNNWSIDKKLCFIQIFYPIVSLFPYYDLSAESVKTNTLENLKEFILKGTVKDKPNEDQTTTKIRTFARNKEYTRNNIKDPNFEFSLLHKFSRICNETILYVLSNLFNVGIIKSNIRSPTIICETLFVISPRYTYNLSCFLLSFCKSSIEEIRKISTNLLFLLIHNNYQIHKNLSIMQAVLVSAIFDIINIEEANSFTKNLLISIQGITQYSEFDEDIFFKYKLKTIIDSILFMVEETLKIKESKLCFHAVIKSIDSIASKLKNIPEIRIKYFMEIKQMLDERELFFHAGLCCVHSAMIVSQYLSFKHQNKKFITFGKDIFDKITSNYTEECFTFELVLETIEISNDILTETTFQDFLNDALLYFVKCKAHKIIVVLCDILRNTYLQSKDIIFAIKLNNIYLNTLKAFEKNKETPNLFTYFRVVFFHYSILDEEKEFVYCEPPHTKLPDFTSMIEESYSKILPESIKLQIIRDSAPVEVEKLSSTTLYIQITSVCSYLNETDSQDSGYPSSNVDFKYFYYNTPFTLLGQARGDLDTQYQRQTIIETESFIPSLNPRVRIVSTREDTLKPIHVIQGDISKRTRDLVNVLKNESVNLKMLQLNLQGCIGAAVNQGPHEAAKVFLYPFLQQNIKDFGKDMEYIQSINKLALTFKHLTFTFLNKIYFDDEILLSQETMEGFTAVIKYFNTESALKNISAINYLLAELCERKLLKSREFVYHLLVFTVKINNNLLDSTLATLRHEYNQMKFFSLQQKVLNVYRISDMKSD
ncbi:hypothetical protein HZS_7187, partial [Henneguya salminicola]